ncbi:MAG: glycosyltransferase family 4 protein [Gammaproteobacteria bacterium]
MNPVCWQINLQHHFGGGEVYTGFLTRALRELGWTVHLLTSDRANYWDRVDLGPRDGGLVIHAVADEAGVATVLPAHGALIINHGAPHPRIAATAGTGHRLTAIAHMPVHNRNPEPFKACERVFGVSRYVLRTLADKGVERVHAEPLYGVADLSRGGDDGRGAPTIRATSRFDWDRRKLRDRTLSVLEPAWRMLRPAQSYRRTDGIHLGVVSRLTTIKQFPELFIHLAPILAEFPHVHLDIFGAGGWRSVRDLERALEPMGPRVHWWGFQRDVRQVYRQLDYVLSGLPELEALGLNLLEAQAAGTPVLAVDGAPFDETVDHGHGGLLYSDPRRDRGAGFRALMAPIFTAAEGGPGPVRDEHLNVFSMDAFVRRLRGALEGLAP